MKPALVLMAALFCAAGVPARAEDAAGLGEVVVTANRNNARYAQQERPVVGVRRPADFVALPIAISSDQRDAETRKREIHAMLAAVLDRAGAAGVELVAGSFELTPVTRASYPDLPLASAGRVDTSQVNLFIKTRLAGSTAAAEARLVAFIKSVPKSGRGAIDRIGPVTLTITNPDQYRDTIVQRVADSARRYAAMFGPDYAVQVAGIDGQVLWSQVSDTDVFLYVPYRYTIVPR